MVHIGGHKGLWRSDSHISMVSVYVEGWNRSSMDMGDYLYLEVSVEINRTYFYIRMVRTEL